MYLCVCVHWETAAADREIGTTDDVATNSDTINNRLQHATTHCNTLQHTTTRCNTLQHAATRRNTPQHKP